MKPYLLKAAILGALAAGLAGCGPKAETSSTDSNPAVNAAPPLPASAKSVPAVGVGNRVSGNSVSNAVH